MEYKHLSRIQPNQQATQDDVSISAASASATILCITDSSFRSDWLRARDGRVEAAAAPVAPALSFFVFFAFFDAGLSVFAFFFFLAGFRGACFGSAAAADSRAAA